MQSDCRARSGVFFPLVMPVADRNVKICKRTEEPKAGKQELKPEINPSTS